jgi:hypothetical protein
MLMCNARPSKEDKRASMNNRAGGRLLVPPPRPTLCAEYTLPRMGASLIMSRIRILAGATNCE